MCHMVSPGWRFYKALHLMEADTLKAVLNITSGERSWYYLNSINKCVAQKENI